MNSCSRNYPPDLDQHDVKTLAHFIWEKRGKPVGPEGDPLQDWNEAELLMHAAFFEPDWAMLAKTKSN